MGGEGRGGGDPEAIEGGRRRGGVMGGVNKVRGNIQKTLSVVL